MMDLPALNFLEVEYPRPTALEWINRGTDLRLRPSKVDQLLRTVFEAKPSASIVRDRNNAGLRAAFRSEQERNQFAEAFRRAQAIQQTVRLKSVSGAFPDRNLAEAAVTSLQANGVPRPAISIMWRTGQFIEPSGALPKGHSKASVASATAVGGIAGAIVGLSLLFVPGLGGIVAAGSIAAAAIGNIGALGSAVGATGGAIARMLTDIDVDGREAEFYESQVIKGLVFVSVEMPIAGLEPAFVHDVLEKHGARRPFFVPWDRLNPTGDTQ